LQPRRGARTDAVYFGVAADGIEPAIRRASRGTSGSFESNDQSRNDDRTGCPAFDAE